MRLLPSTAIYVFLALTYMLPVLWLSPSMLWGLKALPVLFLLAWLARQGLEGNVKPVYMALLCCAAGDVLIALNLFIGGLVAFLFAHLCYAWVFFRHYNRQNVRWPVIAGLLVFLGAFSVAVLPHSGEMQAAVVVYALAILTMACIAAGRKVKGDSWVLAGACCFVLSDAIIGWNKFVYSLPYGHWMEMTTYYLAQYLIVMGIVQAMGSTLPSNRK